MMQPGRLARWGVWGHASMLHAVQVSRCGIVLLSLVSCLFSSARETIPGQPEISQGERTPRTHDLQMSPDRIKSPIPPELSNNGGELGTQYGFPVRPHPRLSPNGPWVQPPYHRIVRR
jgi:hypothetical protein